MSQEDPASNETKNAGDCDPKAKSKFKEFHIYLGLLIKKDAAIVNPYNAALPQRLDECLGLLKELLV